MKITTDDTPLLVIDPQNDALSEKGLAWSLVGESVKQNNTVENLARLFNAAMDRNYGLFISPHYLYPHDQAWQFGGILEHMMLDAKEFYRADPLNVKSFAGSGADWLERLEPFIEEANTVVVSPHKLWAALADHVVKNLFRRAVKNSKWSVLRGYHVMRHSFASNLATAGADRRVIGELMGHTTEEMRKRYRHLFPTQKDSAVLRVYG